MATATSPKLTPQQQALAADLTPRNDRLATAIGGRIAACQATETARAALTAAEQAERLARSEEDVAAADLDRRIQRHAAESGQPVAIPLSSFRGDLVYRIAAGDTDERLPAMVNRIDSLLIQAVHQPLDVNVADLRRELES